MNIRARITIIFFLIVIVVVSMISISIYSLSSQYRTQDFYRRLKSRATNSARLLVEYDELNADLLQRMERDNPANLPNQHVTILDNKNAILYQSDGAPAISVDSVLLNRIRKDLDIQLTRDGLQVVGFLFTEGTETFTVVGAATDIYGLDMLDNLRSILLTIFVLSLITVSPLAWFFAGSVVNPISRIVNEVDAITENNLDLRLDEGKRHDELGKLALTFNKMIARLQDAFISQKNFIANASHEIKTPITVMTGEIEVTLLQRRTPEYYEKVLRSVLRGVRGMNKLFTQLLLLAHTSNGHSGKNFTSFRIDDVMWSVKDELTKVNPAFVIDIEFDSTITDDSLVITGDEGLLKVVLNNLIENSCKYSTDQTVHIVLKSTQTYLQITFTNNGPGINSNDESRIFEPFYRGESGKNIKGFGIGLPLTKKIIELHSGIITVSSMPDFYTTFSLTLPKTPQPLDLRPI